MTTLVLRLAAPLQSWGTSSRWVRRLTDRQPSRSGIIGLLAAAQGLERDAPLEKLRELRIGVRADQPGLVEREFQTARTRDGSQSMPLSERYYLADAVFAVAIEGDPGVLAGIRESLRRPKFPVYLGRRSCPPAGKLDHGLHDGGVLQTLQTIPWLASAAVRSACTTPTVSLMISHDCPPKTLGSESVRDEPISFDPGHRRYDWRSVLRGYHEIENPDWTPGPDQHEPMDLLGENT
ncbi:type I-E CRISPR-associated protein Cas5/CasD [Actinokineospora inagensis]|uniref:type I-E CRISPR-associated protein Cas5/CasD n=1 Tax=Actinokineospora inagensis TaxID=103730 RepID=UPI00041F3759|nr:type I-E CRISPR-associated protein Cas5/CasD [Actinokineospora inagensis]